MSETQTEAETMDHAIFRAKHPGYQVFEKVIILLAAFTLVELVISVLHEGGTLTLELTALFLLVIAVIKATMIAAFFMHIYYERKPLVVFFFGFVAPMMVALPIALVALTI